MQLVKIFLVCLFMLSRCAASAQEIDWNKTTHWTLYDLKEKKPFGIPIDSLRQLAAMPLPDDTMHFFLQFATAWPKEKSSIWMGEFLASYNAKECTRKIIISTYGGFFYDERDKRYYQLSEPVRKKWMDWLDEKMNAMNIGNN